MGNRHCTYCGGTGKVAMVANVDEETESEESNGSQMRWV